MVSTPYYFRAMLVLVMAVVAAMVVAVLASGIALGAQQQQQEEAPEGETTQQQGTTTTSSDVQPAAVVDFAVAWGDNGSGQLGDGGTTNSTSPVGVRNLNDGDIKEVSGGQVHSLALKTDGTIWAWGNN